METVCIVSTLGRFSTIKLLVIGVVRQGILKKEQQYEGKLEDINKNNDHHA